MHAVLGAQRLDEIAHSTQVVARDAGKQMVLNLKLKSAVEPVHPRRAVNIHRRLELHLEPLVVVVVVRLAVVHVFRKVREGDLDVEHAGESVGDQQVRDALLPRGKRVCKHCAKPGEKGANGGSFKFAVLVRCIKD